MSDLTTNDNFFTHTVINVTANTNTSQSYTETDTQTRSSQYSAPLSGASGGGVTMCLTGNEGRSWAPTKSNN